MSPVETVNNTANAGVEIVAVEQAEGLKISVKYSTDRFDASDIGRMPSEFKALLEGVVADPEARPTELPLAPKA